MGQHEMSVLRRADHVFFEFDASLLNNDDIKQIVCQTFRNENKRLIDSAEDLSNFLALDKNKVKVQLDTDSRIVTCTIGFLHVVVEGLKDTKYHQGTKRHEVSSEN